MGRLDDIIDRNKNPGKHGRNRFPIGVGLAIFVFIILILMVFTDLDESPGASSATGSDAAGSAAPSRDHHVNDIYIGTPRTKPAAGR